MQAERDSGFARWMLAIRSRRERAKYLANFWATIWIALDVKLPKRWQVAHDPEAVMYFLAVMPIRDLHRLHAHYRRNADDARLLLNLPVRDKATYQVVNRVMKPLFQHQGYRSLAEFERAWDETGGHPPWPRQGKLRGNRK